jgi:hypothetical protein
MQPRGFFVDLSALMTLSPLSLFFKKPWRVASLTCLFSSTGDHRSTSAADGCHRFDPPLPHRLGESPSSKCCPMLSPSPPGAWDATTATLGHRSISGTRAAASAAVVVTTWWACRPARPDGSLLCGHGPLITLGHHSLGLKPAQYCASVFNFSPSRIPEIHINF